MPLSMLAFADVAHRAENAYGPAVLEEGAPPDFDPPLQTIRLANHATFEFIVSFTRRIERGADGVVAALPVLRMEGVAEMFEARARLVGDAPQRAGAPVDMHFAGDQIPVPSANMAAFERELHSLECERLIANGVAVRHWRGRSYCRTATRVAFRQRTCSRAHFDSPPRLPALMR